MAGFEDFKPSLLAKILARAQREGRSTAPDEKVPTDLVLDTIMEEADQEELQSLLDVAIADEDFEAADAFMQLMQQKGFTIDDYGG